MIKGKQESEERETNQVPACETSRANVSSFCFETPKSPTAMGDVKGSMEKNRRNWKRERRKTNF
jgi:hypothetical protein